MRSSWRSKVVAGLAATLIVAACAEIGAHRKDEYLQAARIALDPARARITLDLTAGSAVADVVLAEIDRDGTGTISTEEGGAYAEVVRKAIALDIDGTPMPLAVIDSRFPPVESIRKGEGAIRLELAAALPSLPPGSHRLRYRNAHRTEIGAYLANALVPESARVAIAGQKRDVDQRELIVDYVLSGDRSATGGRRLLLSDVAFALLVGAAVWWRLRSIRRLAGS